MRPVLTKRKAAWVEKRKPDFVRGGALNNPSILEARYAERLERMVTRMTDDVAKEIERFFNEPHADEYFESAQDASVSSQARILTNKLMKRFNAYFAANAPIIAERQTDAANKASSASVHASLKELSGGLSLSTSNMTADMAEVLNASIIEQVSLIKSISMEYLAGVQQAVMRSITTGRGLADLVPYLQKHKGITKRKAENVARDQTRKSFNNLNRGRMQKLGLTHFQWLHTGGSAHPRELHVRYNDRIFAFDDPPVIDENTGERGIPGQAINCRCRMRPVIAFTEDKPRET